MRIDNEDYFHGAALVQVARHNSCSGVVGVKPADGGVRGMFLVNTFTALCLRFARVPIRRSRSTYLFKFDEPALDALYRLTSEFPAVFLGFVCEPVGHICCLALDDFRKLHDLRQQAEGSRQGQCFDLLVDATRRKQFHVYVRHPRKRKTRLDQVIVPRDAFPGRIFA